MAQFTTAARRKLGLLAASIIATSVVVVANPVQGSSLVPNHLDAPTAGLESGTPRWTPWYSSTAVRSTGQAQSGTAALRVDVTAAYGWGVTLNNWPGFAATPGEKVIRFWGTKGAGDAIGASLRVNWKNGAQTVLRSDVVSISSLNATWQKATADVVAPANTAYMSVDLFSSSGKPGNYLLVDEVVVGDRAAAPTSTTTTTAPTNGSPTPTSTPPASSAPTTPKAQICNSSVLTGPSTPPAGAVRVDPGANLNTVTQANPPGTTFWLAPGTHTLGATEWGQVIPKDGNTYVGAPGAVLDGKGLNRYAFTQRAVNVNIRHLTISNFVPPVNEGVVNQSAGDGWRIEYNTIKDNGGAGVFLGSNNVLRYNCLTANGQYGFSMYRPQVPGASAISNVTLDHNEISYNNTGDWEARIAGCGCTGGGKFWDVNKAVITHNWVHHNRSVGLWADTNNIDFLFEGNYINDNASEGIWYEISYNFSIRNNTLKRNALVKGAEFAARNDAFPVSAIYIAESGGDTRVSTIRANSDISGNFLEDNWGGVALWESSNRFCNSPANTSSSYCTKVGGATHEKCVQPAIASQPLYSDCRWKTQNITVSNNDFRFNRAAVGCGTAVSCGKQSLFSDYGTYPSWSPYKGTVIQHEITFSRNNRFSNNRYVGDWAFYAFDRPTSYEAWRAAPYNQDAGSTKA